MTKNKQYINQNRKSKQKHLTIKTKGNEKLIASAVKEALITHWSIKAESQTPMSIGPKLVHQKKTGKCKTIGTGGDCGICPA